MSDLPIDQMLRDADCAWNIQHGDGTGFRPDLFGDLACHVRALAAEVERRRDEADRERLRRCETEAWLTAIKAALAPWAEECTPNWDGSLCGVPTAVRNTIGHLSDEASALRDALKLARDGLRWGCTDREPSAAIGIIDAALGGAGEDATDAHA